MSGRALYQAAARVVQGMKDQASRCDSTVKKLQQARRFSPAAGAADSAAVTEARKVERQRRSEESLRTVMFLSCWASN